MVTSDENYYLLVINYITNGSDLVLVSLMKRDKERAPIITRFIYAQEKASVKTVIFRLLLMIGVILFIALTIYMWNFFSDEPHYMYSDYLHIFMGDVRML